MENWELFEIECKEHLVNIYSEYGTFTHLGGAISNVSDIKFESIKG